MRGSTAEVASSSTRTAGRRTSARARARRWRWPPERLAPRSPRGASRPPGSARTTSSTRARRSAAQTASSSGAPGSPSSASVTFDAHGVLEHERRLRPRARRAARGRPVARRAGRAPSTRTEPRDGSYSRLTSETSVVLPAPVGPTTAIGAAGRHVEVDVVQQLQLAAAGQGDRAARRRAARPARRRRRAPTAVLPTLQRPVRVDHPGDPVVPDERPRQLAEHPAERPHRHGEQGQQVGRRDDVPGPDVPCADLHGPDDQHEQGARGSAAGR